MIVRLVRRALVGTLFAASLGVTACGSPPSTPEPTASPTTPAPVQASPNPNLVEFETHLREATSRENQLIRALAAVQNGPNDRLALAARQLAAWASDEATWLEDHDADTCYEEAWQTFASAVDDVSTAASVLATLASHASPPTGSEGQEAGAALGDAGDSLNAAADLANQARAACRR